MDTHIPKEDRPTTPLVAGILILQMPGNTVAVVKEKAEATSAV